MCECYKVLYESGDFHYFEHISDSHYEDIVIKITLINNKLVVSKLDSSKHEQILSNIKTNYCPNCGKKNKEETK